MDQEKIGCFLKQLRRERGLTQEQLGVNPRTVSRWETARTAKIVTPAPSARDLSTTFTH